MPNLKNSWKNTGLGVTHALKGLGKTIITSGKTGVDKAVEWAGREDVPNGQPAPAQTAAAPQPAVSEQPAPAQAYSVADEIRKLASLKEQGVLTEEEFTAKKKQLLGL